ncbi:MAG: tRNA pseudouridine(54/55) synthase Pus10 [Rhabdochlamydiaceae bacterium]
MRLVSSELSLCRYCLEREGIRVRGKQTEICELCNGLLSNLKTSAVETIRKLSDYEFETFLIGASIPQSVLDKEDELRSRLKIKGKESIKSQITRMISKQVEKSTGKKIDYSRPDLTVLISLTDGIITVNSRSIWLGARYRKNERGLPQRASECRTCNGLGCAECNYLGRSKDNIQNLVASFLAKKFEAESCNFVWLGSEDENSLVLGSGRPFYVEVVRPKKRFIAKPRSKSGKKPLSFEQDGVEIFDVERMERKVTDVPQFEVTCRLYLTRKDGESNPAEPAIRELEKNFSDAMVNVRLSRKYRVVQRLIRSVSFKTGKEDDKNAELLIECEGGIPLKKLVTGQDGSVEPNLSGLLTAFQIDPKRPFDILDVRLRKEKSRTTSRRERTWREDHHHAQEPVDSQLEELLEGA